MLKRVVGALALAFGLGVIAPAQASIVARISLSEQRMDLLVDGQHAYSWPVSTARAGYVTPTGVYRPIRTARMWYSRKYDMAPMPYSVFFHGGYAIHGTGHVRALGRPASHGCVRLNTANAAILYSLVQQHGMGDARVVITR